jgi:hypothetical protein
MTDATPSPAAGLGARLALISLDPGLPPDAILDELWDLPETVGILKQQAPQTYQDSATVVFIDDPAASVPSFGMIVVLVVQPSADAAAMVDDVRRQRWGNDELHTVTDRSNGNGVEPAYVDFWRVFPPGQFAIPNQPVYFRIWYRGGEGYVFQVIGSTPANRDELTNALVATLSQAS